MLKINFCFHFFSYCVLAIARRNTAIAMMSSNHSNHMSSRRLFSRGMPRNRQRLYSNHNNHGGNNSSNNNNGGGNGTNNNNKDSDGCYSHGYN